MNCSLSERTTHRREDFIVFQTKNTAFLKNPSVFTIGNIFLFFVLCIFQKTLRSIWKPRKNRPFMPFSAFTEPSKKASGGRILFRRMLLSCYYNHSFFRKNPAFNSVFLRNGFCGGSVSFCDIPDIFAFFRIAEKQCFISVLNFFILLN